MTKHGVVIHSDESGKDADVIEGIRQLAEEVHGIPFTEQFDPHLPERERKRLEASRTGGDGDE